VQICRLLIENKVAFLPGKAANAGGVAVSGLEMAQNSQRYAWTFERADAELKNIMVNIYKNISAASEKYGAKGNYIIGANIAGFVKVADSMLAQGVV
jgi:glutamate dehydrogenase (NADP+)